LPDFVETKAVEKGGRSAVHSRCLLRTIRNAIIAVTQDPARIPSLDGLRAFSIALVLFAHTAGTAHFPSFVFLRRNLGNFGVRIFFVISGFLITTLLLNELAKRGRISLKMFYLRRVFRIFPAAYAYLAVMTVLTALALVPLEWNDILHGFSYTTNYDRVRPWLTIHLWSLSVEEQFYMIWPAVLALAGRALGLRVAASMLLVAPLLRVVFSQWIPSLEWTIGSGFPTNADALAAGCLLAGYRAELWQRTAYRSVILSSWFWLLPAALLTMVLFLSAEGWFMEYVGYSVLNIGIAMTIDRCVRMPAGAVGKLLNSSPMVMVGVLSYSIYLWQEPFLNRLSNAWWTAFPVNLILVAVCALASYLLVEKPFLDLRKKIEKKVSRKTREAVAVA